MAKGSEALRGGAAQRNGTDGAVWLARLAGLAGRGTGWPSASTPVAPGAWDRGIAVASASVLCVAAVPLMMSLPDKAAEPARPTPPAAESALAPQTLVAAYGGVAHTHSSDVHFAKPGVTDLTAKDVDWIGRPFKSPIYYGLRAMHWPAASRFGGMVDFTHAKAISVREQRVRFEGTRNGQPANTTATIGDTFRHLEFSHGHNMLTMNGLVRLGALSSRFVPYVGGGFGVSLPHTEVQFRDETRRTYEYQLTGGVSQFVAGVEIRLPRMSVLVEYKFSFAPYWVPLTLKDGSKGNAFVDYWGQIGRWWRGEQPEAGLLTTTLATHHVVVGVGYRHAGGPVAPPR